MGISAAPPTGPSECASARAIARLSDSLRARCDVRGTGGGRRVWGGRGVEAWGGGGGGGGGYAWGREARGNIQHVVATAGLHGGTRRVLTVLEEYHACAQTHAHAQTHAQTNLTARARARAQSVRTALARTHSLQRERRERASAPASSMRAIIGSNGSSAMRTPAAQSRCGYI
jgi:hypothetical protein